MFVVKHLRLLFGTRSASITPHHPPDVNVYVCAACDRLPVPRSPRQDVLGGRGAAHAGVCRPDRPEPAGTRLQRRTPVRRHRGQWGAPRHLVHRLHHPVSPISATLSGRLINARSQWFTPVQLWCYSRVVNRSTACVTLIETPVQLQLEPLVLTLPAEPPRLTRRADPSLCPCPDGRLAVLERLGHTQPGAGRKGGRQPARHRQKQ